MKLSGKEAVSMVESLLADESPRKLEKFAKENPRHILTYVEVKHLQQGIEAVNIEKCVLILSHLLSKKTS